MKRIWFAAAFLIIAAALCVGEQYYVRNFCNNMNEKITAAEAAATEENKEKIDECIKDISRYWDKNNDLIFVIANHEVINELGSMIRGLDTNGNEKIDEVNMVLGDLKGWIYVFRENQKIEFSNII